MKNEGEKIGTIGEDTIYEMRKDNMRILEPDTKTVYIPSAANSKLFMALPATEQP